MTRITSVEIKGFKGIESLQIDASRVNLVTGRNNTGKTSLLEAIALAFDPTKLTEFSGNLDTLIHAKHDRARIVVECDSGTRCLELKHPDEETAREILVDSLAEASSRISNRLRREFELTEVPSDTLRERVEQNIAENVGDDDINRARGRMMVVTLSGETNRFVVSGGEWISVLADAADEAVKGYIGEEAPGDSTEFDAGMVSMGTYMQLENDRFLDGDPPVSDSVSFIDTPDLTALPSKKDDEADAVKIDDIEEFLIENEIVDDLRSFNLESLVFESDSGEKYSVPYEFMGDGFKAIIGILWELLDDETSGEIALLEEPGVHMHPGYIRELIYFLITIAREDDTQLFVTTHNNDFINDFFAENLTEEEQAFLKREFSLIQMQPDAADVMSYAEAEESLKKLHLDLRGL